MKLRVALADPPACTCSVPAEDGAVSCIGITARQESVAGCEASEFIAVTVREAEPFGASVTDDGETRSSAAVVGGTRTRPKPHDGGPSPGFDPQAKFGVVPRSKSRRIVPDGGAINQVCVDGVPLTR